MLKTASFSTKKQHVSRSETHAQRVYRYRRAFRGVIEMFGREYDRALKVAS